MARGPQLIDLASAIADGAVVDWSAVPSSANDESRAVIANLRVLEGVASVHATLPPAVTFIESLYPTVFGEATGRWGPLEIVRKIGSGAHADVYLARDPRLDRPVALKLLRYRQDAGDASVVIDEARLLARVRHPNVVTVYGAERIQGRTGIWMEYVDGRTLEEELRASGPFSADDVCRVGIAVAEALTAVHAAGLVHRDVKAQNVLRAPEGRVLLSDFGTGRDAGTGPSELAGTPLYLAPEVLKGAPADARSDLYSLGVLLFHLATGAFPVAGRSISDLREAHAAQTTPDVRARRPDLSRPLAVCIDRALSRDPATRFESAAGIERALRALDSPKRWLRAMVTGGIAVVVLIAGAGTYYGLDRAQRSPVAHETSGASLPAADITSMTVRLLPIGTCDLLGRPSLDGRYVPCFNTQDNLVVRDLATGAERVVLSPHDAVMTVNGAHSTVMSPDGRRVAYAWTLNGVSELGIVNADGTGTPVTLPTDAADWPAPLDWSRDGRRILCLLKQKDGSGRLALISANATPRTPQVLETFRQGTPKNASLSPDGRFVAYDLPRDDPSGRRAIFVTAADGSSPPRALLQEPANDQMPFWTPDGQGIFFVSDRSGSMEGWVVPVSNGVAAGDPQFVARDLGRVGAFGLTDNGSLMYGLQTNLQDVFVVPIDLTGATPPGTPVRVSPTTVGHHIGPGWSPDGRWLSYISASGDTALDRDSNTLTLQDLRTGSSHSLLLRLSRLGVVAPRWASDSKHLAVEGEDLDNLNGYFIVDAATGHLTPILRWSTSHESDYGGRFFFTPDGKAFLYLHRPRGIIRRDLNTGEETVVVPGDHSSFVPSPDGVWLAFTTLVKDGTRRSSVLTIVAAGGGPPHDLFSANLPERLIAQAWSTDSRVIILTRFAPSASDPHHVWSIDRLGGGPIDMHLDIHGLTGVNALALSPDGRHLAYTEGAVTWDVRVMDRFLPPLARQPSQ